MAGTIIVGVDGSEAGQAALAWAIEQAQLGQAEVTAVHAWQPPSFGDPTGMGAVSFPLDELAQGARATLADAVAQLGDSATSVRQVVAEGSAAGVLLDHAAAADLVVVGSRGRGGFAGLLLGSVSHQVAQHATCPVVIVPTSRGASDS